MLETEAAPTRRRTASLAHAGMRTFEGIRGGVYRLVQTLPQFEAFFEVAMQQPELAVDTETSGLDWVFSDVCGIVIGWGVANNYYLPIAHRDLDGNLLREQLDIEVIRGRMQMLLGREDTTKIFWNAKFDLHGLRNLGIEVGGLIHDPLFVACLLDENESHALKDMSVKYLDPEAAKWESRIDEWRIGEARRRRSLHLVAVKEEAQRLEDDDAALDAVWKELEERGVLKTDTKKWNSGVRALLKRRAADAFAGSLLARNKKDDISYDFIPLDEITPYACADVHYTWLLHKKLLLELIKTPSLQPLYVTEVRLTKELFEMEHAGVPIDAEYLRSIGPKFDADVKRVQDELFKEVGYEFDIGSAQQLIVAFQAKGIELTKETKGSKKKRRDAEAAGMEHVPTLSVDADVIEELAIKYPFAALVTKYRALEKLKGTYVDGILERLDSKGFVHTTYNQNVTTGRMSSREPNLNNIPARDKVIRKAFVIPGSEYLFVFVDYSQIELRLTADRSGDPVLLSCYPFEGKGKDVHTLTLADVVLSLPVEQVDAMKEDKTGHLEEPPRGEMCRCPACSYDFYRNIAKRVNFGIIYGAQGETIQRQVSTPQRPVSKKECEEYIEKYFDKYRGVRDWVRDTYAFVRRYGWVRNTFGRYRRFDLKNIPRREKWRFERAERQAGNYLIQGEAADLFKTSIVRVGEVLRKAKARTRLVNVVHDEIQFYWHKDELELLGPVRKVMENYQYKVPIVAEFSVSQTDWAAKKGIKL